MSKSKVKLIHASDLKTWTRFKEYHDHDGPTLAEYEARRKSVRTELHTFRNLNYARERLAKLDVMAPVEYAQHEIPIPRSVGFGLTEVPLPAPDHPKSTILCDTGEVVGLVLQIRPSWLNRTVTARYSCPSRVLNADEIARLKDTISRAGDEAHARLAKAQMSRYLQPVLFISHRWDGKKHPDPDGQQLARLQALEDCFLIYDYASFPQDTSAPEDEAALLDILNDMNSLISNVLVMAAPDFLERGWCIYEYIVASMRASIVCDELNDPNFVFLRNLAATQPLISFRFSGGGMESELENAKNQGTLETVNKILPLFNRSRFTVERDRQIVRDLLVSELLEMLPRKMEYQQYLGEWKTISWKKEELQEAFASELQWEPLQYQHMFKPYQLKVPTTVAEAVKNGYQLDKVNPMNLLNPLYFLTQLDLSQFNGLADKLLNSIHGLIRTGRVAIVLMFVLVVLCLLVRWIFF